MDQLIYEIEGFCARHGMTPQRLLRDAINATWGLWQKWKDNESSPTMKVADRIRAYMAEVDAGHTTAHDHASPPAQEQVTKSIPGAA